MEDRNTGDANLQTRDVVGNTTGEIKKTVNSEEKARASQIKLDLCSMRLKLEDTKSVLRDMEETLTASVTDIFDELMVVKANVDERTMLDATLRTAMGCERTKATLLERERHVAVVEAGIKERELERWQKAAQDERKKLQRETLESMATMEIDQQKLMVERAELKQEKARLECELDTALVALQAEKAKCKIKITDALIGRREVEENLASAERDRNATALTLAQQKTEIIEKCGAMLEMRRYIDNVTSQKRNLIQELLKMKDEVFQNKKVMEVNLTFLEQTDGEKRKLEDELSVTEKEAIENKRAMQEAHEKALGMATSECKKVGQNLLATEEALEMATSECMKVGQNLLATENFLRIATRACMKVRQNLLATEKERLALQDKLLSVGRKARDNKRKMAANQVELEQAKGDCKRVKNQLNLVLRNVKNVEANFAESVTKLDALQAEKSLLEKECQSSQSALSKEKEKSLCEICMESQKDTICLPCLHLRYCFVCLEKHRKRARTCPFCRTILSGVLRSDISMCGN